MAIELFRLGPLLFNPNYTLISATNTQQEAFAKRERRRSFCCCFCRRFLCRNNLLCSKQKHFFLLHSQMALRSFSNAKLLYSALIDAFSVFINRRGFSAVAPEANAVRGGGRSGITKVEEKKPETIPWVPDSVTGFYRPENRGDEIDAAELRNILLNHKIRQQ